MRAVYIEFDSGRRRGIQHCVLQNAVLNPATPPTVKLYVDGTHYYSGSIIVTNVSPSVGVDGLAEATVNFRFTGAVSYT
mgnify:CR=1 FL=1